MRPLLLTVTAYSLLPIHGHAQGAPVTASSDRTVSTGASNTPDTVVVTATRTARDPALVPATVSVLTAEDIERQIARDMRDLIRYEPGVSVGGTGDRFGLGGFSIRGIGGNRVLTIIDGARVADSYSFGPFLSAGRNYVDIDGIKAFEIVRGPGSALYGSDALGGVVAYRTKDALDYLDGGPFYAGFKAGYSGVDSSTVGTVTLAGGSATFGAMILHTDRQAHETENYGGRGGTGTTRELPDPIDRDTANTIIKLSFRPSETHAIDVATDMHASTTETEVLSNYNTLTGTTLDLSEDAFDDIERDRVSIAYRFTPANGAIDQLSAQLYSQSSAQFQRTRELRESMTSGMRTHRRRDSSFEQEIDGLSLQLEKSFGASAAEHYLVAGIESWTTESLSLRDGGTTSVPGGVPLPEFTPLPTRDFPPTTVDQTGVYIQDEIRLLDDRLTLTPSVRFDSFDADTTGDAIYFAGNPGQGAPEDYADSEVSPKLGLLYRLTDGVSLYAQYAEGFKAPPYDDVNVGFTNPIGGYKSISNPDLVSETSRSNELGLRIATARGQLSLVAFRNRFEHFIEALTSVGIDPNDGFLVFQSQNLDGVAIDGFEAAGRVGLGQSERVALNFSLAYSDGETETGQPLNSIDPLKSVLGLGYTAPDGDWSGELVWTLVAAKEISDINGDRLPTPGYGLVDLLGRVRINERMRLNFGLFNLTDKRYIEWADTPAIGYDATTDSFPEAARFTRPGRNAGLTLRVEF